MKRKTSGGDDEPRVHNKSGSNTLTILEYNDDELLQFLNTVKEGIKIDKEGMIEDSPCYILNAKDGKITYGSKKIWAYHIVAYHKFGRREMNRVPSNKKQDDLVISHLCGSKSHCCNPDHLSLETKKINDERTHCHYCIRNILKKFQYNWDNARDRLELFFQIGSCNHDPKCCSINVTVVDTLFNFKVHVRNNISLPTIISTTNIDD